MSDLTRKQIEQAVDESQRALDSSWYDRIRELGDMALRTLDAEDRADRLQQEAEIHAQEARTANGTLRDIFQLCSGATGEPGNWNGAEPVRRLLARAENAEARIRQLEAALRDVYEGLLPYVIGIPELDTPAKMHRRRIEALLTTPPPDSNPAGTVVVTTNERGDAVAVTRQNEEGEILSVIWERGGEPAVPEAVRRLPDKWLDAADWYERKWREQEGRGCYHAQASTIRMLADELERALAQSEQGRVKTAWHPVSDPPKYDLIDGKIHPWVLWQEDSETTCPQRVGADEIGNLYTAGWWAWPHEVLAAAPQPQDGEKE